MTCVVFDTNCLVKAVFWPASTARTALTGLARRRFATAVTSEIVAEYRDVAQRLHQRLHLEGKADRLAWFLEKSRHVGPILLTSPLSRDSKDDKFIACALAAKAAFIVSEDRDLLVLGKPFGIAIVTPIQLVKHFDL